MGSFTVVHVHPNKQIKNKRITYTYDCSVDDCDKRASSTGIYLHIMRYWHGAVPVRINEGDIDPFATGDIHMGIGDPCDGFTWVVYYDYVKPQYGVSISACGIGPGLTYQVGNGSELDISPYSGNYCGRHASIPYRGSIGLSGIAVDTKKDPELIPQLKVNVHSNSVIMIGRQMQTGGTVTQGRQKHVGYNNDGTPRYESYTIFGPGVTFSNLVSDVSIYLGASRKPLGPPVTPGYGVINITTWIGDDYVDGVKVYNVNRCAAIGASRVTELVPSDTGITYFALRKYNGIWIAGSGSASVGKDKNVDLSIQLQEIKLHDIDVVGVIPVTCVRDDGTTYDAFLKTSTEYIIKYMSASDTDFAKNGLFVFNTVVGSGITRIKGSISTNLAVLEFAMGGVEKAPIKGLGGLGKIEIIMGRGRLIAFEDYRLVQIRLKTAKELNFAQFVGSVAYKVNYITIAGLVLALFTPKVKAAEMPPFEEEIEEEEGEEIKEEGEERKEKQEDNDYTPIIPYTRCITTLSPTTTYTDDPIPTIGPIGPIGPIDPVILKEKFQYLVESEAIVANGETFTLYSLSSKSVEGEDGDVVTVGFSLNTFLSVERNITASRPYGILCLLPNGIAAGSGGATLGNESITIPIGQVETGSRYVLLGDHATSENDTDGKLIITTKPNVTAKIIVYTASDHAQVASGVGPMMTTTLIPGVYTIEADAAGYRPVRNVIVALDSNKTENVVLQMLSDGNYTVTFYVNAISPTGTQVYITSSNYVGNIFKAPLTMTVRVFETATYKFHAYSEVTPRHVISGGYVINISPQSPRYVNINIPLVFAIPGDVL